MKAVEILLIEDDGDDIDLLKEALESQKVPFKMKEIRDGAAAADHIQHTKEIPEIIIMDFNLPRVHGREIIRRIRHNDRLRKVPILILSTSSMSSDISYAYDAGATKYLVKPATLEAITEMVNTILHLTGKNYIRTPE